MSGCIALTILILATFATWSLSPDYRRTHYKMHKVIVYDDSGCFVGMSRVDSVVVNKKSGTISMWVDGKYVDL